MVFEHLFKVLFRFNYFCWVLLSSFYHPENHTCHHDKQYKCKHPGKEPPFHGYSSCILLKPALHNKYTYWESDSLCSNSYPKILFKEEHEDLFNGSPIHFADGNLFTATVTCKGNHGVYAKNGDEYGDSSHCC